MLVTALKVPDSQLVNLGIVRPQAARRQKPIRAACDATTSASDTARERVPTLGSANPRYAGCAYLEYAKSAVRGALGRARWTSSRTS